MRVERRRAAAAVMVMAAMAGVPCAAAERECALETRLEWVDVGGLAPFAHRVMAGETARTLADHGVCAKVVLASPWSVRGRGDIGIVLLRSMAGSGVGRHVMGATRTRDPRNATVWVYFDAVASALGLAGRSPESWTAIERFEFGRALGRVAAHEVVHALLPGRPHDRVGLMTASLGRHALTVPEPFTHPGLVADMRAVAPAAAGAERSWVAAR